MAGPTQTEGSTMPRLSSIEKLTPEQQAQVDAIIRRHRYADLDGVKFELEELGIKTSRSAVHRYAQRLNESDSLNETGKGTTIVLVIDTLSDQSRMIRTAVSPDAVISAIGAITASDGACAQAGSFAFQPDAQNQGEE
jgi:hypothetical protein